MGLRLGLGLGVLRIDDGEVVVVVVEGELDGV